MVLRSELKPGRLKEAPPREHRVASLQNRKPAPWLGGNHLHFGEAPVPWKALGYWSALQFLNQPPSQAAWDLRHAAAVEDLLIEYIQTLPHGTNMPPPRLFIYTGTAYSRACPKSGIDAPAYCPGDHTVYLETGLGDQVASKYGDFGALSILSHEFGHAYMSQRQLHPPGKHGELAADAFAGGFARYVEQKGLLEAGDIDEARATFASVGDYQVYHHDHHGTPKERRQAFEDGYRQGFRLPGEPTNAPPSNPQPTALPTPTQAPTTQPQESPPRTEQPGAVPTPVPRNANETSNVAPILGLGLGAFFIILILIGVIALVNRTRDEEI